MGKILLVDDDVRLAVAFSQVLRKRGHEVVTAESGEQGLALLEREGAGVVVLDIRLPGASGLETFRQIKTRETAPPVIIMTGESTMQNAIEAMALGAFSYQLKPFDPEEMLREIERALEDRRLSRAGGVAGAGEEDQPQPETIIGRSPAMQQVYKSIGRVAPTHATVLIRGGSGSGKELVARVIHRYSPRREKPFIAVNCLAIPETLLESELFGHEKGAFTGADARRIGRFEQAAGGTLFLDEIGDIPASIQGKLLRVLQERVFTRVGGEQTLKADVRIISATNRDLEQAVRTGSFREDLLYRLNVVTIRVPPLRERAEDIPSLVQFFVQRFAREFQVASPAVTPEAMQVLTAHSWPGNVREVEHCICRAMVFHPGAVLSESDVKSALDLGGEETRQVSSTEDALRELVRRHLLAHGGGRAFDQLIEQVESVLIAEALRMARGNQSRAAKLLGLARQTFRWKLNRSGAAAASPDDQADG